MMNQFMLLQQSQNQKESAYFLQDSFSKKIFSFSAIHRKGGGKAFVLQYRQIDRQIDRWMDRQLDIDTDR